MTGTRRVGLAALVSVGVIIAAMSVWSSPRQLYQAPSTTSPSTPHGNKITWDSAQVTITVSQGASTTIDIRGRAFVDLPASTVTVTPSLGSFITPVPAALTALPSGSPILIRLNVAIPATVPLGNISGTLHIKKGAATIDKPLPITLVIVPPEVSLSAIGLTLKYPPSWHLNQDMLTEGPIGLDNFGGNYGEGGVAPAEGAEITMSSSPAPQIAVSDLIARDLSGTTIESTDADTIAGLAATRVTYTYTLDPAPPRRDVMVLLVHTGTLYRFVLSYEQDAAGATAFQQTFNAILSTIQFPQ